MPNAATRRAGGSLRDLHIVGADVVFSVPALRELMLLANFRSANAKVLDKLLADGKVAGVFPGGIHEQLASDPSCERLFFARNLGFVRAAIKQGVPLVPMYNFGENQLFDIPKWSRRISDFLYSKFGAGAPLGFGRWGLPLLPNQQAVETRFGMPVDVGPAEAQPSQERVERVFRAYCAELHRLFEEHKSVLPEAVAARGLEIVWRGHESVDLSVEALRSQLSNEPEQAARKRSELPVVTAVAPESNSISLVASSVASGADSCPLRIQKQDSAIRPWRALSEAVSES